MANKLLDSANYSTYVNPNTDAALGTSHISNNLHGFEMARSGFFTLSTTADQFSGYGQLHSPYTNRETNPNDLIDPATAAEVFKLNVVKTAVPTFTLTAIDIKRGNGVVRFASVPEWGSGSFTIDDVVGQDTKAVIYAWWYQAFDPFTQKVGRMEEYKKKLFLTEYTQGGKAIRIWTLEGAFITSVDEGEFDKENDDKRQISVSFSYDRAWMNLPNKITN